MCSGLVLHEVLGENYCQFEVCADHFISGPEKTGKSIANCGFNRWESLLQMDLSIAKYIKIMLFYKIGCLIFIVQFFKNLF